MVVTRRAVTYASYLKVPELLALQVPQSDGPEHDELLFIVIHQVYELWFKQLRHELRGVQAALETGDTDLALHLLNRVLKILKTLVAGPQHGYGIAQILKTRSQDVFDVGESSLYPALQRLLLNGWVKAQWGASENNRRARYYTLTAAGKKRLSAERQEFDRIILAIHKVLNTT